ncbi:transposase [Flavobacterium sp. YJ01]|uniref:transposase n=1 Tax=unclassified Flavobacterium TaxID=196869 RepID=UPI0023E40413|nr:transposase [Flavobacterium sp. YJ01]WET03728.1 transposase [Flavobacterium sp. YJ01]
MKKNRKLYDRDFKLKAVFLSYENGNSAQTARDLQIDKNLLSLWRKEYKNYGTGCFPGYGNLILTSEEKRKYNLEKQIKETDLKFEIIKNASKYICLGKSSIFHFMAENEKNYSVRLMCEAFGINRGTYRTWKKGLLTETQKWRIALKKEISLIFLASKETYGCHRIRIELQKSGYFLSHTTVLKCMRELGLYVSIKKNNQVFRKTNITNP